ncbi:MAG: hypothetical protein H0W84_07325 [Bacteroidetes bacterium]|nr:hypothetical protein [Bacteroidota bacterium]
MNKTSTSKKIIKPIKTKMNETIDNKKEFPFEPGNNVINSILNYSKALSIRKSKSMEHFELVLN